MTRRLTFASARRRPASRPARPGSGHQRRKRPASAAEREPPRDRGGAEGGWQPRSHGEGAPEAEPSLPDQPDRIARRVRPDRGDLLSRGAPGDRRLDRPRELEAVVPLVVRLIRTSSPASPAKALRRGSDAADVMVCGHVEGAPVVAPVAVGGLLAGLDAAEVRAVGGEDVDAAGAGGG